MQVAVVDVGEQQAEPLPPFLFLIHYSTIIINSKEQTPTNPSPPHRLAARCRDGRKEWAWVEREGGFVIN